MKEPQVIIELILLVIQFLVGISANGFIVVVNGIGLIRQKKMIPLNLLLSCLAISRIFLQLIMLTFTLTVLSLVQIPVTAEAFAIFMFVYESGIWFATLLGVFYCVKIATIVHPLFFWLKMRISKMVPWLILGILLYTFGTSVYHARGTGEAGTSVHYSALMSILSFLVLHMSHYMTELLLSFQLFHSQSYIFWFFILVIGTYPCGHSIILILGNSKLRQSARKLLLYGQCCRRQNFNLIKELAVK
ncbi:taste receptor type 2 member 1 [Erinaceus europaeus]|uniref:Taste receptor type 2 member 1 n=1 Tax=Erinaceus europaeus TaxID=9365 RepID=A0ABM3XGG0_ERIEU|nr:taste receptor type 2 member 1 [Erinaceus europaeus]